MAQSNSNTNDLVGFTDEEVKYDDFLNGPSDPLLVQFDSIPHENSTKSTTTTTTTSTTATSPSKTTAGATGTAVNGNNNNGSSNYVVSGTDEKQAAASGGGFFGALKGLANRRKEPEGPKLDNVDEYQKFLEQSQKMDFSAEKKQGFLYRAGFDTLGRPIIVFVAAYLPGQEIDPDRLLLFVISEMDAIVVKDYSLVYVHTNFQSQNRPPFSYLRKAYRILSRKYKKNLKALYIVHPTFWIKTTFKLFKPFLSQKFWQKLNYINEVPEIYKFIHRDQLTLPQVVYQYNAGQHKSEPIFGTPLIEILERPDHTDHEIPIVVQKSIEYLVKKDANKIQGIFRLSGSSVTVAQLRKDFDKGDDVNLDSTEDPHVIAGLLKLFFREMPEPLFPFDMYDKLIQSYVANKNNLVPTLTSLLSELPVPNKALLRRLLELLAYIEKNSEENKMNSSNLSIVFAPNLIRAPKESLQQVVMHSPIINSIMRTIIEHHEEFIPVLSTKD